jgi:hypothetical protein
VSTAPMPLADAVPPFIRRLKSAVTWRFFDEGDDLRIVGRRIVECRADRRATRQRTQIQG